MSDAESRFRVRHRVVRWEWRVDVFAGRECCGSQSFIARKWARRRRREIRAMAKSCGAPMPTITITRISIEEAHRLPEEASA